MRRIVGAVLGTLLLVGVAGVGQATAGPVANSEAMLVLCKLHLNPGEGPPYFRGVADNTGVLSAQTLVNVYWSSRYVGSSHQISVDSVVLNGNGLLPPTFGVPTYAYTTTGGAKLHNTFMQVQVIAPSGATVWNHVWNGDTYDPVTFDWPQRFYTTTSARPMTVVVSTAVGDGRDFTTFSCPGMNPKLW